MKKLFIALLSISLLSPAFAAGQFTVKSVKEVNKHLVIHLDIPFQLKMNGMSDDTEESIQRGLSEGVALQYFGADQGLDKAKVDKNALIQQVNQFTASAGKYYKSHPELKGALVLESMIFPGYKKPFQLDLTKSPEEYRVQNEELNKLIKKHSECNKEKMCQVTIHLRTTFINFDNPSVPLNKEDFSKFLDKQPHSEIDVYTKERTYLNPIKYVLVYGTNGYHVEPEQIKEFFKLSN